MRIAVPKETQPGERRAALVPESVQRLVKKGFQVVVQAGAGEAAYFTDEDYRKAGASVEASPDALWHQADMVLAVRKPTEDAIARMREGAALVGFLQPLTDLDLVRRLAQRRITAFALETLPRITLAQSMDALTSMSTIAGYKAVLVAAHALPRFFPMLMTAAGTVAPAKVLVIGAGVAGLQAIATAKRLGAVVEAFDQRPVVKEQVESLGGRFVEVPTEEEAETAGGYAKEMSEEYRRRQTEVLRKHIVKADVVITTALIPGKRAPLLITEDMVRQMRPGSVIVDLAAEQGGNCALTEPGKEVLKHGVLIIGPLNLPSTLPFPASQMISRNLEKLILHLANAEGLKLDLEDEITRGTLITHGGEVVHPAVREKMTEA